MSVVAMVLVSAPFPADRPRFACRRRVVVGRDAAPSGEPARQRRVGGEGTRLTQGVGATPFFRSPIYPLFFCGERSSTA